MRARILALTSAAPRRCGRAWNPVARPAAASCRAQPPVAKTYYGVYVDNLSGAEGGQPRLTNFGTTFINDIISIILAMGAMTGDMAGRIDFANTVMHEGGWTTDNETTMPGTACSGWRTWSTAQRTATMRLKTSATLRPRPWWAEESRPKPQPNAVLTPARGLGTLRPTALRRQQ